MHKLTGILLAGGESRRYGSPKAFANIDGVHFYKPVYHILQSICDNVVIVTRPEFIGWFPKEYHVIVDVEAYKGCGPLSGIYAGMMEKNAENYLVLPCDMPLLQLEAIKTLTAYHHGSVTAVKMKDGLQPLVSVWNRAMKQKVKAALDQKNYALQSFLKQHEITTVAVHQLTKDPTTFLNINTMKEDKEMRKWLKL